MDVSDKTAGCGASTSDILKHSSGDLHSRLKTRKLLGVGETDDGDVHRSKLSQILGHSEQLYVKLPRGLRLWQFCTAVCFTIMALWGLMFPKSFHGFVTLGDGEKTEDSMIIPLRMYAAALLSLAIMYWSSLQSLDKDSIRCTLLATAVYFIAQIIVLCADFLEKGAYLSVFSALFSHRSLFIGSVVYFYWAMETKYTRMKKSNSNSNLNQ